jgi:hypothetical protein
MKQKAQQQNKNDYLPNLNGKALQRVSLYYYMRDIT